MQECFVDASAGPGLLNFVLVISEVVYVANRGLLDEGWRLQLSVDWRANVEIVIWDCNGLVK